MTTFEIIEIGDELGMIIPDEVLARWDRTVGDTVYLTESENSVILSPEDPSTR